MVKVFLLSSQESFCSCNKVVRVSVWSHVIKPVFIMLTGVYIPECYQSLPHIGLLGFTLYCFYSLYNKLFLSEQYLDVLCAKNIFNKICFHRPSPAFPIMNSLAIYMASLPFPPRPISANHFFQISSQRLPTQAERGRPSSGSEELRIIGKLNILGARLLVLNPC